MPSKRERRARPAGSEPGQKGQARRRKQALAHPEEPDASPRLAFFERAREYAPYVGVEAGGSRFLVATSDQTVGRHLFVKQGRPEFRALRRAVSVVEILTGDEAIAGRVFVDVGANIGTSTVAALTAHRFGSAVACEPEEETYRLLRANLALNDLLGRAKTLRVAVSNRVGHAELVVLEGRRALSWIAIDRGMIEDAEAARARSIAEDPEALADSGPHESAEHAEMTVVDVELVTLDRLAETGVIETDHVGMIWIDAEGHEGHVLDGAGTLADRGVPIVFEFYPEGLEERGDRGKLQRLAEQCYTHFVDVRRQEPDQPRFRLRPVTELPRLADRFLDPASPGRFTDLLLLRLDAGQARVGEDLPELFVKRRNDALGSDG